MRRHTSTALLALALLGLLWVKTGATCDTDACLIDRCRAEGGDPAWCLYGESSAPACESIVLDGREWTCCFDPNTVHCTNPKGLQVTHNGNA